MSVDEEWGQLSTLVRGNFQGGKAAFAGARDGFYGKFGGTGEVAKTIGNINTYYASLKPIDFPPKAQFGSRPGQQQLAHPNLVAALGRAVALLVKVDPMAAKASLIALSDVGTLAIRANVNDNSKFSLHSFGWAIDLNATSDSNVAKADFPETLFTLVTGLDVYGAQNVKLRNVQPYDQLLPLVRDYCHASDAFRAAFVEEGAFDATLAHVLQSQFASAQAADNVAALVVLARAKPVNTPALVAALDSVAAPQRGAAAQFLTAMCALFAQSKALTHPEVEGNAATVARYGYVNLHAEMIAALMAEDGGNLIWLGDALGAKDPMHFELRPPYPALF